MEYYRNMDYTKFAKAKNSETELFKINRLVNEKLAN